MKYCNDAIELYNLPSCCCDSCHDEADEGYSDLFDLYVEGDIYLVCCGVIRALEDKGIK